MKQAVASAKRIADCGIDQISGSGGYHITSNSLHGQTPSFRLSEKGWRVTHREYVCDVVSSTGYFNRQFFINPGNSKLFPWLSGVAGSFEEYYLHGLIFNYRPMSGTSVADTASLGSVILATEYDVVKPAFTSKSEAEAYRYCTQTVPYQQMIHPVECANRFTPLPRKFITDVETPSGLRTQDDPRLNFHGNLQLMVQGSPANAVSIGELWVSYDITLLIPRPRRPAVVTDNVLVSPYWTDPTVATKPPPSSSIIALDRFMRYASEPTGNINYSWGDIDISGTLNGRPLVWFKRRGVYRVEYLIPNVHTTGTQALLASAVEIPVDAILMEDVVDNVATFAGGMNWPFASFAIDSAYVGRYTLYGMTLSVDETVTTDYSEPAKAIKLPTIWYATSTGVGPAPLQQIKITKICDTPLVYPTKTRAALQSGTHRSIPVHLQPVTETPSLSKVEDDSLPGNASTLVPADSVPKTSRVAELLLRLKRVEKFNALPLERKLATLKHCVAEGMTDEDITDYVEVIHGPDVY